MSSPESPSVPARVGIALTVSSLAVAGAVESQFASPQYEAHQQQISAEAPINHIAKPNTIQFTADCSLGQLVEIDYSSCIQPPTVTEVANPNPKETEGLSTRFTIPAIPKKLWTPNQLAVFQDVQTSVFIPSKEFLMAYAGIGSGDWGFVDYIVNRESGWCATIWNGERGCPADFEPIHDVHGPYSYGVCQAQPAIKMESAGLDWVRDIITQLRWCDGYVKGRYGNWANAQAYWAAHHGF